MFIDGCSMIIIKNRNQASVIAHILALSRPGYTMNCDQLIFLIVPYVCRHDIITICIS